MNVAAYILGTVALVSIGGLTYLGWALRKAYRSVEEAWAYRWAEHTSASKVELAYYDLKNEHAKMTSVLEEKEAELNAAIAAKEIAERHRRDLLQRLTQNLDTRSLVDAINVELQNLSRLSRSSAAQGGARQGTVYGPPATVARDVAGKSGGGR